MVENGYFNIVKFCIPAHDEFNIEAPEEIAELVAEKLHYYMVKAGKFICKIVPLEAEVSRHKICSETYKLNGKIIISKGDIIAHHDKEFENLTRGDGVILKYEDYPKIKDYISNNGPLPTYWIH